jgi:hypothetical protein
MYKNACEEAQFKKENASAIKYGKNKKKIRDNAKNTRSSE